MVRRASLAAVALIAAAIPGIVHAGHATVRWQYEVWGWLLVDVALVLLPLVPLLSWRHISHRYRAHTETVDIFMVTTGLLCSLVSFGLAVVWV